MKTLKTILCAVALTAAFVTAKADYFVTSKADFVVTASGAAEIQTNLYNFQIPASNPSTFSFNNKYIYSVLSNAVLNVASWAGTNIATTNFPADGYIAFSPEPLNSRTVQGLYYSSFVGGLFYVTNKAGFYYPLSGFDAQTNYYSWMELDSENHIGFDGASFEFGWNGPFAGVASFKVNTKLNGTQTETSPGVLYIHDDPYCYDDADNPMIFKANLVEQGDDLIGYNANALEVRGLLTVTLPIVNDVATISSLSITGTGNLAYAPGALIEQPVPGLVKTATVKFAK